MADRGPLDLAFVGSGNAFAPARCWSGFLLNDRFLFDAPPTALYALKCMRQPLAPIDAIFISHFHADHFFGLPFLLIEYDVLTRRSSPLTLIGPPGLEDRLMRLMELGYPSHTQKPPTYGLRFVEIDDGSTGEVAGLRFEAVEVEHGGEALRAFGFRTELNGRVLAYTGDSQYCEPLLRLGRGADVLVGDCTYASGRNRPAHMSFDEISDLRDRLGGDTRLVLTHLGPEAPQPADTYTFTVAADQARYRF